MTWKSRSFCTTCAISKDLRTWLLRICYHLGREDRAIANDRVKSREAHRAAPRAGTERLLWGSPRHIKSVQLLACLRQLTGTDPHGKLMWWLQTGLWSIRAPFPALLSLILGNYVNPSVCIQICPLQNESTLFSSGKRNASTWSISRWLLKKRLTLSDFKL